MPPKSAAQKAKAAAESASDESDAGEPVVKKRAYKRKTGAEKQTASPQSEEKKPAPKRAKKQALTEPETTEEGWTLHPPSLIYRGFTKGTGKKIAAFDLDGTLAVQKSTLQFPRDADDWVLYNKKVPDKLKELESQGYRVVIFSNQGGIKSALKGLGAQKITKRVSNVLEGLGMPHLPALLATNKDEFRKPDTGMWDFWVREGNGGAEPDKSQSFFVGDAAGGAGDFADSDKKFAENVSIGFKTSREFFGDPDGKIKAAASGSSGLNNDMAATFRDLSALQDSRGDNPFGVRATAKAAAIIEAYPTKITSGKELAKLQGIGKATVTKIDEFLQTGTLSALKKEEEGGEEKMESKDANMAMKFV